MTRKYFGTDGIRGTANTPPMTPEIAMRLGMAAGKYFRTTSPRRHSVVIGKDTIRTQTETLVNGEDFLLRRMAGHLVLSQPVAETGQWEVIVLRKEGDEMVLGVFEDDDRFLRRMGTLLEVDPERLKAPGTPGYRYSLLRPTAKEFKVLLKEQLYEADDPVPLPKGGTVKP